MNKYLLVLLCCGAAAIAPRLCAQSAQPLGTFEKPSTIKRYPTSTPIALYRGSHDSEPFALTVASPELLLILQLDSSYHPKGMVQVPVPSTKVHKDLKPTVHYQHDDTDYILVEREARSNSLSNEGDTELPDYVVLSYHPATQAYRVVPLAPLPSLGTRREVLSTFAHRKSFWLLTAHEGQQLIELYRYQGAQLVDTRTVKLSDDQYREYTRRRADRREPGMDVWFSGTQFRHVPNEARDFQMLVFDDELILTRSYLKPSEQAIGLLRFGVRSRKAEYQQVSLSQDQSQGSLTYVTSYNNRLVLARLSQQQLKIELRSIDALEIVETERAYDANNDLVRRLNIHASSGGRTPLLSVPFAKSKNPFLAVGSLIGPGLLFSSHYSSYSFTGSIGEFVLGFAAQWTRLNVPSNTTAGGGTREFSTIALRLDGQTLELLDPPSGPLLSDLKSLEVAQDRLTRSSRLRIKAERLLSDGSMIALAQDISSDMIGIFRLKP